MKNLSKEKKKFFRSRAAHLERAAHEISGNDRVVNVDDKAHRLEDSARDYLALGNAKKAMELFDRAASEYESLSRDGGGDRKTSNYSLRKGVGISPQPYDKDSKTYEEAALSNRKAADRISRVLSGKGKNKWRGLTGFGKVKDKVSTTTDYSTPDNSDGSSGSREEMEKRALELRKDGLRYLKKTKIFKINPHRAAQAYRSSAEILEELARRYEGQCGSLVANSKGSTYASEAQRMYTVAGRISGALDGSSKWDGLSGKGNDLESRTASAIVAIVGLLGGLFFLSSNITGFAVSSMNSSNSSFVGTALILAGLLGAFVFLRKR